MSRPDVSGRCSKTVHQRFYRLDAFVSSADAISTSFPSRPISSTLLGCEIHAIPSLASPKQYQPGTKTMVFRDHHRQVPYPSIRCNIFPI